MLTPASCVQGKDDRCRHELGRLVACVAKHQTLVAGADDTIRAVYTLADVRRLAVEADLHFARIGVKCVMALARVRSARPPPPARR